MSLIYFWILVNYKVIYLFDEIQIWTENSSSFKSWSNVKITVSDVTPCFVSQHLESHSKSLFCWWIFNIQSKLLVSHKVRPKHFASLRHQLWHNKRNFHQFSVHFFCHIWFLTNIKTTLIMWNMSNPNSTAMLR